MGGFQDWEEEITLHTVNMYDLVPPAPIGGNLNLKICTFFKQKHYWLLYLQNKYKVCIRNECWYPGWPGPQVLLVQGSQKRIKEYSYCVTRAPLLYFIRSWVALSFKVVSQSVSLSGMRDTLPNLHFVQYIKVSMPFTESISSITAS